MKPCLWSAPVFQNILLPLSKTIDKYCYIHFKPSPHRHVPLESPPFPKRNLRNHCCEIWNLRFLSLRSVGKCCHAVDFPARSLFELLLQMLGARAMRPKTIVILGSSLPVGDTERVHCCLKSTLTCCNKKSTAYNIVSESYGESLLKADARVLEWQQQHSAGSEKLACWSTSNRALILTAAVPMLECEEVRIGSYGKCSRVS
jgi:hypothetical protein